jgi:hypothetical protein
MTLSGGAVPQNIVWVVAGDITAGAGASLQGVILAQAAVTLDTGATLNGQILCQTGVALQEATVVQPA